MTLPITSWHADEGLPNARPLARCAAMPLSFDRDQLPIWRDERNRNSLLLAGGVLLALVIALSLSRSEEHTSELQSLMRISYAVFCLKKKKITPQKITLQSIINHT